VTFAARFEDDAADRRENGRRTLRLDVPGTFAGGAGAATVHNISPTGLLIETTTILAEGDCFAVDLPEAGGQMAEVVWASAPMFGCRFSELVGAGTLSAAQLRGEAAHPALSTDTPDDLGARLKHLRRERGLSLGDIAARLGVSKPTVWAWEHGKSRPIDRRLSALADVLGVTPEGLDRAPSGANDQLERSRRQIADAYGVELSRVRIMIEL
jgi:transcriptional regulator with XRE-family HTH domain